LKSSDSFLLSEMEKQKKIILKIIVCSKTLNFCFNKNKLRSIIEFVVVSRGNGVEEVIRDEIVVDDANEISTIVSIDDDDNEDGGDEEEAV